MAEVLFVLLIVYVVYVVQSVVYKKDENKENNLATKPVASAETANNGEQKIVVEENAVTKKAIPKKVTTTKTVVKEKAKPKAKSKTKAVSGNLRNPETGDVDKIASSYRMCKRWIKEALVTEGLLPKVYKTTELDDAVKLKAKKAIDKLAKMDKYQ